MSRSHDNSGGGQQPQEPSGQTPRGEDYATNPDAYRHHVETHPVTLAAADAAAIDALVDGTDTPAEVDAARLARAAAWVDVLTSARAAQPPIDLLDRTLEAVREERLALAPATTPAMDTGERSFSFTRRLAEYAAMAVAASVVVAVLIPGISQARQSAKRVACANNMQHLAHGFAAYATNFAGALPSLAMPTDGSWDWKSVRPLAEATETNHSNAANMIPLVREKYVRGAQALLCPAQGATGVPNWQPAHNELPDAARGYSYVVLGGASQPRWDRSPATIVLADRNPLFCPGGACTDAHRNSFNHGRVGNYVLRADGTVRWEVSPDIGPNRDNIWTVSYKANPADPKQAYKGTELPGVNDVFLSP